MSDISGNHCDKMRANPTPGRGTRAYSGQYLHDAGSAVTMLKPGQTLCPQCGAKNTIVNQCGCDPNNMPTSTPPNYESTPPRGAGHNFALIDIHVNKHTPDSETTFWLISALAHVKPTPGDDSPTEFGDSASEPSQYRALEYASDWAALLRPNTPRVCIFLNGNEWRIINNKNFQRPLL